MAQPLLTIHLSAEAAYEHTTSQRPLGTGSQWGRAVRITQSMFVSRACSGEQTLRNMCKTMHNTLG